MQTISMFWGNFWSGSGSSANALHPLAVYPLFSCTWHLTPCIAAFAGQAPKMDPRQSKPSADVAASANADFLAFAAQYGQTLDSLEAQRPSAVMTSLLDMVEDPPPPGDPVKNEHLESDTEMSMSDEATEQPCSYWQGSTWQCSSSSAGQWQASWSSGQASDSSWLPADWRQQPEQQQQQPEQAPWPVPAGQLQKPVQLPWPHDLPAPDPAAIDWNSPSVIEIEKRITFMYGKKFKERGPPAPSEGGPELWRNQKYRESSGRWGNRGGKHKHEWTAYFANKGKEKGQWKGEGDDKGKGKGKNTSKGPTEFSTA